MGCCALVFQGCKREPEKPVPPSHMPESYMHDENFRTNLAVRREARGELTAAHSRLAARMKEMVDAKMAELKIPQPPSEADVARVKSALERDPEWKSLYDRCADLAQAIKENRRDAMRVVRERIVPKKQSTGDLK